MTSDLRNHPQRPATCLYILILLLISSTVKPTDTELHYYLPTSSQPNLSGFQSSWKEVRLKEIVTLIVPQSSCRMKGHVGLWSKSFKGVHLRPSSGHKEANTQNRVQPSRSNKGEAGNWGEEKVSRDRGKGGKGAGRSISAARTHSRFSK